MSQNIDILTQQLKQLLEYDIPLENKNEKPKITNIFIKTNNLHINNSKSDNVYVENKNKCNEEIELKKDNTTSNNENYNSNGLDNISDVDNIFDNDNISDDDNIFTDKISYNIENIESINVPSSIYNIDEIKKK